MKSETIIKHIKKLDGDALRSWGAYDFSFNKNNTGVKFKTSSDKYASISVKYNNDQDVYDIDFLKEWEINKSVKGLYFDQVIDVIDDEILPIPKD